MKTIVDVTLKQSKYIFEDDVPIEMEEDRIVTPNFIIGDLNSKNSILYENVTAPDDWFGNKYKYINNEWISDSTFIHPADVQPVVDNPPDDESSSNEESSN